MKDFFISMLAVATCKVFPINILFFPLFYWLPYFIFILFTAPKNAKLSEIIRKSTSEWLGSMSRPATSIHVFAFLFVLLFLLLEFTCGLNVNKSILGIINYEYGMDNPV